MDERGRKKAFVTITGDENIYKNLILQASKKLHINGNNLVLESDGTPVTENKVLLLIKTETLVLLEKDEVFNKIPDSCTTTKINENSSMLNIPVSDISFIESNLNTNTNYEGKENIADNSNQQETLAIIQVINVRHEEDFNWIDYKIPWNKIPINMLKICDKGVRNKSVITEICHIIVNDVRQINKNVPITLLKKIASEIILKYPETFMDKDEDRHILGDGSCTMFHKLRERCCYMKRIERKSAEKSETIQAKKRKFHVMAGCSNYQDLPSSSNSTNAKNIWEETYDEELFENMMDTCYTEQRKFLENFQEPPSLNDIKKEFPILLKLESVIFHFNKLTGKKLEDLPKIMKEKSTKIVEYAIQNKYLKLDNEDYCIQSLKFFALYFKEDFEKIYYKIENENTNISEILQINAPCIVSIGNHFQVLVEKQLFQEFSTFM